VRRVAGDGERGVGAMPSFQKYYRNLFRTFGYPLTERSAISANMLAAAEKRLGVKIPRALQDYYLVAGRERRFGRCHNRLLAPEAWVVDRQRLIFMEENQAVILWGVSLRNPGADNPSVFQGINDDPIQWALEHRKFSMFLAVMLHYQAVCGGFRFCAQADAPDGSAYRFEEEGWTHYGEVNSLQAYSRANQVVCLMRPGNLPFMQNWSVLAGGKTRRDLQAIGADIGVHLE